MQYFARGIEIAEDYFWNDNSTIDSEYFLVGF
jgi:hypothetical protein